MTTQVYTIPGHDEAVYQVVVFYHKLNETFRLKYGFRANTMRVEKTVTYSGDEVVIRPNQYTVEEIRQMHPSNQLHQMWVDNSQYVDTLELKDTLESCYMFRIPLPNDRQIDLILAHQSIVQVKEVHSHRQSDKQLVRDIQNQKSAWNVAGIRGKR